MADANDDALAATAVGLNEDAKAARKTKKAAPEPAPAEDDEPAGETVADRIEAAANSFLPDVSTLVADVRDFLLTQVKQLDKPWSVTPFDQQRDIAAAVEQVAEKIVAGVAEAVASGGAADAIRCNLEGFTDKGDNISLALKVKAHTPEETLAAVVLLHKAKGKNVMLRPASVEDYRGEDRAPELDPDNHEMDFEAGDIPEDDSDLAGDGPSAEELKEAAARDRAGAEQVVVES